MVDKNIKAIIFDWGGVCCSEGEPFASSLLQQQVGKHPNDICQEVLDLYLDFYRGKYTTDEFYKKVLAHYYLIETEELNPRTLAQAYLASTEIWPDVLNLAQKLQGKYKVGLLSDLTPVMKDYIHRQITDLPRFFPLEVYSCDSDVGLVKTDGPVIFELVLRRLGVSAPDALFIDNSQSKIQVARALGFNTLLFENRFQLFKDIAPLL